MQNKLGQSRILMQMNWRVNSTQDNAFHSAGNLALLLSFQKRLMSEIAQTDELRYAGIATRWEPSSRSTRIDP